MAAIKELPGEGAADKAGAASDDDGLA